MFHKMKRKRSFVVAFSTISSLLLLLTAYQNCGGSLTALSSADRTSSSLCSEEECSSIGDGSANQWIQVPKRTQAQKTAGIAGGEGWQMIFGITYAPSDPTIAWLCTDTNQVWKTTNANADPYDIVWKRKANGFFANGAASIVVDPTNSDIVYAAGSEMPSSSSLPISEQHVGEGIFRTTDGGDNWTRVKDAHFHRYKAVGGVHFAFAGITIYAAQSEGGLLKSTNGGTTWNLVNKSGGGYVLDAHDGLYDIKVHPTDNTILFVSTGYGLYKVEDSGSSATVTKIGTGLPSKPYATVINHNNPNIMFATAGTNGVYKSTDGGLNFTQTKASPVSNGKTGTAKNIAISPVSPDKVMVGFLGLWPTNNLYYTHDGGANWYKAQTLDERNVDGWVAGSEFEGELWTQDFSGSGVWAAPVAFHPTIENTALISGHGDIVRKTSNGGAIWEYANTGYTGSAGIVTSPSLFGWDSASPSTLATFHMDHGPMLTTDGEDTFKSIGTAEPKAGAAGGAIKDNVIVEINGNWTNGEYTLAVSRNSGASFSAITDTAGKTNDWVTSLVSFHPQNDNIVYAGKYRFDNIGTSSVYTITESLRPVYGVWKENGDYVYSFSGSTIYKSTNRGGTWATPYPSLNIPSGYSIKQIAIDPTDENRIYAAVRSKGIYIVTNTTANGGEVIYRGDVNGITKSRYGTEDINSVAVDPNNPNVVYAAAYASWYGHSNGVFRSTDYGMTWTNINGNLGADMNIQGLGVNPHNSYVYISSHAGTWKLPPPFLPNTIPTGSVTLKSGAAYTNSASVTVNLTASDDVGITDYYLSTSATKPLASDSGWVAISATANYSATVVYTLLSGDGTKTLYAHFKDAAGNVSSTASDSIVLDTTQPTVAITTPTSNSVHIATSNPIALGGSASDTLSNISSVTWSNSRGGSGAATGTMSWSASGIDLQSGDNIITITAKDGANNIKTNILTITFNTTSSAPTATTANASDITSSSVTLNGSVNPNGLATTVWFQYGTVSGSYGSTSATKSISGTSGTPVSIALSGLSANKTYYYRIVAQNSKRTTYGSQLSFVTVAGSSVPTGSIKINSGAVYTKAASVTVQLSATDDVGVTGYYLSTSSAKPLASANGWVAVSAPHSYSASVSYTLPKGDGPKALYAHFKNAAGNVSNTASDAIVLDTIVPAITITSPTSLDTYTTASATINLAGTASDSPSGISSVTWSKSSGEGGTASGNTNWSISAIALTRGSNTITVTAKDGAGNLRTDALTVNYSADSGIAQHPQGIFFASDIPAIRARTKEGVGKMMWDALKIRAATHKTKPLPISVATDDFYPARQMALVYLIDGDLAFGQAAVSWLMHFVQNISNWNGSYVNGGQSYQVESVALTYDWVYPLLTSTQRIAVQTRLAAETAKVFALSGGRARSATAVAVSGYVLSGERSEANSWIAQAKDWYTKFGQKASTDGIWACGPSYMRDMCSEAVIYLRSAIKHGTDLTALPFYRAQRDALVQTRVPTTARNVYFSWGDDSTQKYPSGRVWYGCLLGFAGILKDGYLQTQGIEELNVFSKSYGYVHYKLDTDFLLYDPMVQTASLSTLPLFKYFSDSEVWISRSSWSEDGTHIYFKAGPPTSHTMVSNSYVVPSYNGHSDPDGGKFLIFSHGNYLVGNDAYAVPKNTGGHSTLLVDNGGQYGSDSAWGTAPSPLSENSAGMLDYLNSSGVAYGVADISALYPQGIDRIQRHILHLHPDTIIISDDLSDATSHTFTWRMTQSPGHTITKSSDRRYLVKSASAEMQLALVSSVPVVSSTGNYLWNKPPGTPEDKVEYATHLDFTSTLPTAALRFLAVLHTKTLSSVPLVVNEFRFSKGLGADLGDGRKILVPFGIGEFEYNSVTTDARLVYFKQDGEYLAGRAKRFFSGSSNSGFEATSDVAVYFKSQSGKISIGTAGVDVTFFYPGITAVLVNGQLANPMSTGPGAIRVHFGSKGVFAIQLQ